MLAVSRPSPIRVSSGLQESHEVVRRHDVPVSEARQVDHREIDGVDDAVLPGTVQPSGDCERTWHLLPDDQRETQYHQRSPGHNHRDECNRPRIREQPVVATRQALGYPPDHAHEFLTQDPLPMRMKQGVEHVAERHQHQQCSEHGDGDGHVNQRIAVRGLTARAFALEFEQWRSACRVSKWSSSWLPLSGRWTKGNRATRPQRAHEAFSRLLRAVGKISAVRELGADRPVRENSPRGDSLRIWFLTGEGRRIADGRREDAQRVHG